MNDYLRRIAVQFGAFLRTEALSLGMDDRTFYRHVRAGDYVRLRHGAYTFPDLARGLSNADRHKLIARAAYRTSRTEVAISHASAINEITEGHWDLDLRDVHLTRLDGRAGRREAGLAQHRGGFEAEDIERIGNGFLRTSATRSALDYASTTDLEHTMVVFDTLLREKKTDKARLMKRYLDGLTQVPGSQGLELAINLSDGDSGSVGESRGRYAFWTGAVPMPVLQHPVYDGSNLLGIADWYWPNHDLLGEFDGLIKYRRELLREGESPEDVVIREKLREDAMRAAADATFFRITWHDLDHRGAMLARLENTLRGPRHRVYLT